MGAEGKVIADEIRARAKKELGLTVSVGVSFGKVFAKLADLKKPDATTCVTVENFRKVVWPLPARALLYVGPATERRLRERNIRTIGDIRAVRRRCAPCWASTARRFGRMPTAWNARRYRLWGRRR